MQRGDNMITLWTVQALEAYEVLERTGVLYGTRERIMFEDGRAYGWLCNQMKIRGILPEENGETFPIWAWYKLEGKEPDLRALQELSEDGQRLVALELRVSHDRVLLSDFDLWHYVLNDWYVAATEEEDERFQKFGHFFNQHRQNTWPRIFKVGDWKFLDFYGITNENEYVQGTLWHITMDDVVNVHHLDNC